MPKNNSSYQRLSHDKKTSVYHDYAPQKVLTMQDPYNSYSYDVTLETLCVVKPNIKYSIVENFK